MVSPTKSNFDPFKFYIVENNKIETSHNIFKYIFEKINGWRGKEDHTSKKCLTHCIIEQITASKSQPSELQSIVQKALNSGVIENEPPVYFSQGGPIEGLKQLIVNCFQHSKIDPIEESLKEAIEVFSKNVEQGIALLQSIDKAQNGDKDAQNKLGDYFYLLSDVPDTGLAVVFYTQAAKNESAEAQYNLGYCYAKGIGVRENPEEAAHWFMKAAENGNALAQCALGYRYEHGIGIPKNSKEAFKWYQKAAGKELPAAQNNLGYCYEFGVGVYKDLAKAIVLYTQAADQGFVDAQTNLGRCYENGIGVTAHPENAFKWYQKAADQEDMTGQYNLGSCYQKGIGVPVDLKKAREWYQKAADQGHKEALEALSLLPS